MALLTSLDAERLRDRVEEYVDAALEDRGPDQYTNSTAARQTCINELLKLFEVPAEKKYKTHAEIKLISLVGELVEIAVRYEGGHTEAIGRLRCVDGGLSCNTMLWVGETCLPVDAVVYMESSRRCWVFDSRSQPKPLTHTDEAVRLSQEPATREMTQAEKDAANDPLARLLDAADDPNNANVTRIHDEITVHDATEMRR